MSTDWASLTEEERKDYTNYEPWVGKDDCTKGQLVVARASDIKPKKVKWLWQERLPRGKCVLVAGEGGLGKSMVLAWIAATVSRGGETRRTAADGCSFRQRQTLAVQEKA